ncbi:hypothetical protein A3A95_01715 [Candidatus Nomurabacteria bacterium RIFCSPLOWO2_01_FULL_39_18]|uniref:DUF192 domain-containing protein n=1 Tax=Candidatus Nomurabacteria bacterium RIFCSPHIGHO2_01_FULL_40_24b TaxID=1801739 RepID=A0A1F6V9P9_9BACT|nr:MAG: hypothetical protein A2647_01005 [Candidatus Nomurabacteria bacterium RIFCSPHIGHO2_01_FULL_40_24b]OGI90584.1 MAG: hypothetical protein A3A95_01715 [Candidatus Nomurabacteria bacterium RIFCSPLOWO2_01_FULL_39_18]
METINKTEKKENFSALTVLVFLLVAFIFISRGSTEYRFSQIESIEVAGQNIKVDLALTEATRGEGLSGRRSMAEDTGMLFVFDRPDKYLFWMKNMYFPIDIIWINEDMRVVYIKQNAHPDLFLETYEPDEDAKYVLEVVAGFSDKYNLKVGDKVEFGY